MSGPVRPRCGRRLPPETPAAGPAAGAGRGRPGRPRAPPRRRASAGAGVRRRTARRRPARPGRRCPPAGRRPCGGRRGRPGAPITAAGSCRRRRGPPPASAARRRGSSARTARPPRGSPAGPWVPPPTSATAAVAACQGRILLQVREHAEVRHPGGLRLVDRFDLDAGGGEDAVEEGEAVDGLADGAGGDDPQPPAAGLRPAGAPAGEPPPAGREAVLFEHPAVVPQDGDAGLHGGGGDGAVGEDVLAEVHRPGEVFQRPHGAGRVDLREGQPHRGGAHVDHGDGEGGGGHRSGIWDVGSGM